MSNFMQTGRKTFTSSEVLAAYRRVKFSAGSGSAVEYADAGEVHDAITLEAATTAGDLVACQLANCAGTVKVEAAGAFAEGADLYGAADGKVDDTSSGSVIGKARSAATASGDVVELYPNNAKPTTAGAVSIADAGAFTATATVEAALQEIYQHLASAQAFLPISLMSLRELSSGSSINASGNGGLLASDTTPILDTTNGDTDGAWRLEWAASNSDSVGFQVPLPPDLDTSADVVIHLRAAMAGSTDTPVISADSYFNEGDTKVEDDSAALSSSVQELTITIAAADVPSGAQSLSVELTPGAHTTDILYLYAIWIEYTRQILTS